MTDSGRLSEAKTVLAVEAVSGALKKCSLCGGEFPDDFRVCPRDATPLGVAASIVDPLLGTVLAGTYRITAMLGSGAMGRLYEAEHARLDRRFAVKVMLEVYAAIDDIVARFEREARALSRIRSEHVLDVVDILKLPDGRPCIITEKLEGEDLQDKLDREERLSVDEAIRLARQVCRGLAAAHAQGVVHRDLKPSNLFLVRRAEGRTTLKILDFGVAKLGGESSDLTRTGAVVGTPAYMAPEQARGSAKLDHRADIYAVGAVIYRMLTGRMPYDAGEPTATLIQVLEREPERPRTLNKDLPEGLEALIQSAMARDPKARPESASELEAKLAVFAASSDPDATEPGVAARSADAAAGNDAPPRSAGAGSSNDAPPRSAGAGWSNAARELSLRARRARPIAIAWSAPAAFGAGLAGAGVATECLLAAIKNPSAGERWIATACALIAGISAAVVYGRALHANWHSTPEIERLASDVGRGVLLGACALGGLELVAHGLPTLFGFDLERGPLWTAARIALSAAATLAWIWQARRRPG